MPPRAPATRSQAAPAHCPVCLATAIRRRYALASVTVWDCRGCGLGFLFPLPSVEEIQEEFATLYSEGDAVTPELGGYYDYCFDTSDGSPVMARCEGWLDLLERYARPGTLLDVGCGTGLFVQAARRRGWHAFGFDDAEIALTHARRVGSLPVFRAQAETLPTRPGWDAVTLWDMVEHMRDPVGFFTRLRMLLGPNGVVAAAMPNQRSLLGLVAHVLHRASLGTVQAPLRRLYFRQHLLYFTPRSFAVLLERTGFRLEAIYPESTDLRRLRLRPALRRALSVTFAIARRAGLENRFVAFARPRS